MTKLDAALWRDMMTYLRDRHGSLCRQWFEELEPVSLELGTLKVRTTTGVQQKYLQNKCVTQFTEAAQAVTGALVAVLFVNGELPAAYSSGNGNGHDPVRVAAPSRPDRPEPTPREMDFAPSRPGAPAVDSPRRTSDQPRDAEHLLSPDYAFNTFVTGPENNLAYAASVAVANQPGTVYNPLFIHGGVGLGKTHLLQAVCQSVLVRDNGARVCYLSCDTFVNDFLDCVQNGQMQDFRARYRHVDLLVIDDIQFLANRERTQEEFFHTFNELYQSKKQIILSSDCAPAEIPRLEERLVSRFQWGLVADVSRPTFETRVAIVKAKAKLRGIELPEEVVTLIAERIESNARELEGAITLLQASAASKGLPITAQLAYEVLGHLGLDPRTSQVTLQLIIEAVTKHYDVKLSDLQSKRRQKSIAEPRQVCMWLARKRTRFSLQEIGAYFGGRDHTTVMHSIRTVDERNGHDPTFAHNVTRMDDYITRQGPMSSGS
ncbi:MAG: chromosomal replication initiator protein DnaA [Phycisphaeraceae bacterium]